MTEIKINLYQNDAKKKSGAGVEQLMVIQTASSVKHGAVWCMSVLPVTLGYWCLVMMWQKTEAAGSILKCIEIYSPHRFSQMLQIWLDSAS